MNQAKAFYDFKSGSLADIYSLFIPETIGTGAQVSLARLTNPDLRDFTFYTSVLPLATKRDGKIHLGIGGPFLFNAALQRNTSAVCQELSTQHGFYLDRFLEDCVLKLERDGSIHFVDPESLHLQGKSGTKHFSIKPDSYQEDIAGARNYWVQAAFGSEGALGKIMEEVMKLPKIFETRIFIMDPESTACRQLKEGQFIAKASLSYGPGYGFDFDADFDNIKGSNYLMGRLKPSSRPDRCFGLETMC